MRLIAILIVLLCGAPAAAQTLFSMESRETGRAWEAVGRLELGGKSFCTGALIDERIVLTAAHCLYDADTGALIEADRIRFLAGWRNGRASAYRLVRRAVVHPGFEYGVARQASRVRNDVALLELQHPIRNTTIAPFPTAGPPRDGETVGVVSYARDRAEAPSLQDRCAVLARQSDVLVLSCTVDFGASGSPVFAFGPDGAPRIVSVISAMARAGDRPVSLGTALQDPLRLLRAEIDGGDPGAGLDPMKAGARRDTGAKFVRP